MSAEITPFGLPNQRAGAEATKNRNAKKANFAKIARWATISVTIFLIIFVLRNGWQDYGIVPGTMEDMPIIGGQSTQATAPIKATASNKALGDIDPITILPGQTSPEVRNWDGLTVCWAAGLPETVIREEKLADGRWVVYTPGGTNVAHRWKNTGSTSETVYPFRRKLSDGCGPLN